MTETVFVSIPAPTFHQLHNNRGRFGGTGVWRYEEFCMDEQTSAEATIHYDIKVEKADLPEDANAVNVTISNARVVDWTAWLRIEGDEDVIELHESLNDIEKQLMIDTFLEAFSEEHAAVVCEEEAVNR